MGVRAILALSSGDFIYDINREQDYGKHSGGILGDSELRPPSHLPSLLEKTETGLIPAKIFETVSLCSDSLFQRAVSILRTSYLDSASEHGFQYSQVTLVKNDIFLNEYKTFYQEKKASDYTQEELEETCGFLLFETENQAKLVCQRGLCVGSSALTTLGDPGKGVYISKYSDYLQARPWYHGKSGYVVIFNLIKYYLYELSGSTVAERPRQICPYVIVAFQYRDPKTMAAPPHIPKSFFLPSLSTVFISPWKGKLIIQGYLLCDITLWSSYGTGVPTQIPHELDFRYVMKVSSLKKTLPEAAFRKQNYLEHKVCCQDMCFSMYEVELSNKQGGGVDKLTEYIKREQLVRIIHLKCNYYFSLKLKNQYLIISWLCLDYLGEEQAGLRGLHLCHSSAPAGKDLKVEDDFSLKVIPILPALHCALLEAKKSFTEKDICLNKLVKHNFQELYKVDKSPALTAASQDGIKETAFFGKVSSDFDLVPPAEKCPLEAWSQLKSYFSDPSGYILEVSTALDLLAERPQSPCISDGICDAGFSLAMTPDPEFHDSETEVKKETETEKNSEEVFKARQGAVVPLSPASNLRVQPKRKASTLPTVQSKRVSLCRPFPKRTPAGASKGPGSPTTLQLVKGQFPQKRKRGAEVLAAQFVQTAKSDRKNQDAPISEDVPVAANAKRARRREKSPVTAAPRAEPPVRRSPQKQRASLVQGEEHPRISGQPPAEETASQLQSEISEGQKDVISINTAQPETLSVAQKEPPEDCIVTCDSRALNMLADLALSAATSTAPSSEPRNFPCSSELPLRAALLSQEPALRSTSDHEYHRGVKSQKGGPFSTPSSDKSDAAADPRLGPEEESAVAGSQAPAEAPAALPEEALEGSDSSQSSFVAVEHSYALLLAEHSRRHLQQRGALGPAFAKSGTKGPEAGTPVGKVMPFRHQHSTSPLQKLPQDPALRRRARLLPSGLKDFPCSHTVFSCDGSFKVTFRCEADYVFSLDSKYTNNPLEKTVLRALHGPWNTDLPDNVEEVKLLLHMWVALFYSSQNQVMRSSRKVVEHSNPAKYVSINSTLDPIAFSELQEASGAEGCLDPLSETVDAPRGLPAPPSFPDTDSLLPFAKPPPRRGLELWVQSEQRDLFAAEGHAEAPEGQNLIYSCDTEITGEKAEPESSDKLEKSNLVLSRIGSTQTNGPSIPGEDKSFEPLDGARVAYSDALTQTTLPRTYDGISSPSMICQKSVYSALESRVDLFHAKRQTKTGALQGLIQHSHPLNKECQPSLERKDDVGYVMINLEPVSLTFEKNTYVPIETEAVNRADTPAALSKQVSPAPDLSHAVPTFAEAQGLGDIPSPAVTGQKGATYLHASPASRETLVKEMRSLQKDRPVAGSPSPPDRPVVTEALSSLRSSHSSPREEMKLSRDFVLQTQSPFSISSEAVVELAQAAETGPSSASAPRDTGDSLSRVPSRRAPGGSAELKSSRTGLKSEKVSCGSFNSEFSKQSGLSLNREASLEFSEEGSDLDLTLTISPPASPRDEEPEAETEQRLEALGPHLELREKAFSPQGGPRVADRDVNPAGTVSVRAPANEDRSSDTSQTATFVLSKETCALEVAEEMHVALDFPFGSLIEEVSPASSPDPQAPGTDAQTARAVSSCSAELSEARRESGDPPSQMESVDMAVTEKDNSLAGPAPPVGQDNLPRAPPVPFPAETPLVFRRPPERRGTCSALPGAVPEQAVPGERDQGPPLSARAPSWDAEPKQPASAARYRDAPGNQATSGSPLQPVAVEDRSPHVSHLIWDSRDPPLSPRHILETQPLAAAFVSAAAPADASLSLGEQAGPERPPEHLLGGDLKTDGRCYILVRSLRSGSVDSAAGPGGLVHAERPAAGLCSGPGAAGPGPQTQEISAVRMARLLQNNGPEAGTLGDSVDLGGAGPQWRPPSPPAFHRLRAGSAGPSRDLVGHGPLPPCSRADAPPDTAAAGLGGGQAPSASFVPGSRAPLGGGVSGAESAGEGPRAPRDPAPPGLRANPDIHYEPLSGDSDQDSLGECAKPREDARDSCAPRCRRAEDKGASDESDDPFLGLSHSDDDEDWGRSRRLPGLEPARRVPAFVRVRDLRGVARAYANFPVTRARSRAPGGVAQGASLRLRTDTGPGAADLTRSTLDLEYLRFAHKLKQMVKRGDARRSGPSAPAFPKAAPAPAPASRSRSPLVVTVVHSDPRPPGRRARGHTPHRMAQASSSWKERGAHGRSPLPNSGGSQAAALHLHKLKYNSPWKDSRGDISLILSEFAEFNKVLLGSGSQAAPRDPEPSEAAAPAPGPPCPRPASYEDLVADLCASLRVKLERVVKEACARTFLFHLVETADESFFLRTKNLLRKGGHAEMEPQRFCQAFPRENDTLLVIIRNEDIASHLHQIPALLRLKRLPGVLFAGVDSPEDVLHHTYQELFRAGGFVVSDGRILDSVSLVQLKEIVRILEKLNASGRWKWLLHYREIKKLKEDVRVDSTACKKNLILKSYQSANILELLHYHECDSRPSTKAEHLQCLLTLQIQRVHARFAVFLTEKPALSREVFEDSGILVTDVNDFIENMQKVAAPFRSSYW
uniref:Transcription activation suppressor family member 2 n=1 Tax=Sus scrofa TaxID=9823 RepID=A0A8D1DXN1_PIG